MEPSFFTKDWTFIQNSNSLAILTKLYFFLGVLVIFLRHQVFGDALFDQQNYWVRLFYHVIRFFNNILLTIGNFALSLLFLYYTWKLKYSFFGCQEAPSYIKEGMDEAFVAYLMWWFLIIKILEWSDSILLVFLNNMNNWMTWMAHIVHHSIIVVLAFQGVKFFPGGTAATLAMINSMAHFVSYFRHLCVYFKYTRLGRNVQYYALSIQFTCIALISLSAALKGCNSSSVFWITFILDVCFFIINLLQWGFFCFD